MTLFNKIKWTASILLVFAIILTTNLIDKNNFNKLRYSVVTIYEDRIVANDLIFEILLSIREKEIALAMADSMFFLQKNDKINEGIGILLEKYGQTKLTNKEQKFFTDLKGELKNLEGLEKEFVHSEFSNNADAQNSINEIIRNLYDLSKVQLEEGRRQMALSNETMETIDLFTQVEIIFLVLMAILVQIIILYKPKQD
ncbi:MAG: hypothetical protein WA004_03680 [Saprospiraceae bacterium]